MRLLFVVLAAALSFLLTHSWAKPRPVAPTDEELLERALLEQAQTQDEIVCVAADTPSGCREEPLG